MQTLDEALAALKQKSTDEFSRSCIEGAHRALKDVENPLRLNFFSNAMRILFEHMMEVLAPVDAVTQSVWYRTEREDGKPTRGQRITYAIQGGLSEGFVTSELRVDPQNLRKRLLDALDECSKQVHAREYSIAVDRSQQDAIAATTIAAISSFLETLHFCRDAIVEPIMEAFDETAFNALLNETLPEVDEPATHYSVEEVYVDRTVVYTLGPKDITYRSTGSVSVILQYGSNSDLENDMGAKLCESFPFHCDIEVPIAEPRNLVLAKVKSCAVDVSEWHDAMKPDEWDDEDEDDED